MAISTNGVTGVLASLGLAVAATVGAQEQPAPTPPAAPVAVEATPPINLDALTARVAALEARLDELSSVKKYERRIFADLDWQEVVPHVEPGDQLDIVATGTWSVGARYEPIGADGATGGPIAYKKFPTASHGALITTFESVVSTNLSQVKSAVAVGAKASIEVPADYSGPLLLRMNDTDVGNNTGALYVTVSLRRKAAK